MIEIKMTCDFCGMSTKDENSDFSGFVFDDKTYDMCDPCTQKLEKLLEGKGRPTRSSEFTSAINWMEDTPGLIPNRFSIANDIKMNNSGEQVINLGQSQQGSIQNSLPYPIGEYAVGIGKSGEEIDALSKSFSEALENAMKIGMFADSITVSGEDANPNIAEGI